MPDRFSSPVYPISVIETRSLVQPLRESFSTPVFLFMLKGSADVSFGGRTLRQDQGDLIFLPMERTVSFEASQNALLLIAGFENAFFEDQLQISPLPLLSSAQDPETDYRQLKRAVLNLQGEVHALNHAAEKADPRLFRLGLLSAAFQVMKELAFVLRSRPLTADTGHHTERVRKIETYIDLHYSENLTLTDLAEAFSLTPQYLSAFFHAQFQKNFKQYLNEKRLLYSLSDLRNSDLSVNEIALSCGFMSTSAYRKNFRSVYGVSPLEYRAKSRAKENRENKQNSFSEDSSPYIPVISGENEETPAAEAFSEKRTPLSEHIRLNASGESKRYATSGHMINIGSARHLLAELYRTRFLVFVREMDLQYVRIEELLSNSFMPMLLPHYDYYFQNVDIVLNFFYENELLPFIELTKTEMCFEAEGGYTEHYAVPRDDRFLRVLESFLKHVTRRWPLSWLNRWQFELWMLPRDTCESYTKAFAKTVSIIRRYIPDAHVGGPGYDPLSHNFRPEDLFDAFRREKTLPDFFSASIRLDTPSEGQEHRFCSNTNLPMTFCREMRDILSRTSPSMPFYITEWFSVSADFVPITASLYQAAFIVRTSLILDRYTDLSAYWLFSDMDLPPAPVSDHSLSFGHGLFGPHFQPFASYYAFEFLADLGRNLIFDGPCCSFTHNAENHYQLLAFHYTHFRPLADPDIKNILDFDRVYDLFREDEDAELSFDIEGLTPGTYYLTTRILNHEHGSILDTLIEEFAYSNIDKLDYLYFTKETPVFTHFRRAVPCIPFERRTFLYSGGSLTLKITLPPHAVCLWDLRLQI